MKEAVEHERHEGGESYSFSKNKLPSTLSYPLKRSLLDSALHCASVYDAVYSVRYLGKEHPYNVVLDAMFVPEGRGHPTVTGRSLITVWAVPSERRRATEQVIVEQALPVLCLWLAKTQSAGNAWRGAEHSLTFTSKSGTLRCSED